jgi:hypothetical protein
MMVGARNKGQSVRKGRHPVVLGQQLEHVGQHLVHAQRAQAIGAEAVLPDAQQPALEPGQERRAADRRADQREAESDAAELSHAAPGRCR